MKQTESNEFMDYSDFFKSDHQDGEVVFTWLRVDNDFILIALSLPYAYDKNNIASLIEIGSRASRLFGKESDVYNEMNVSFTHQKSVFSDYYQSVNVGFEIQANHSYLEPNLVVTKIIKRKQEVIRFNSQIELYGSIQFNHDIDSIAVVDADLCYLMANKNWQIDVEQNENSIIGRSHYEIFPDKSEEWIEVYENCLKGKKYTCTKDCINKKGLDFIPVNWEITPWFNTDNIVGGLIFTKRNVSEKSDIEELFKYQFEHSPDLIFLLNVNFQIIVVNKGVGNLFLKDELIGKNLKHLLPSNIKNLVLANIQQCFDTNVSSDFELNINEKFWVKIRVIPIPFGSNASRLMIFVTDITERYLAEVKLKDNEQRFHKLLESISDTIILLSEQFQIQYQSPNSALLLDSSHSNYIGKEILDFVHPNDIYEINSILNQSIKQPEDAFNFQARILKNQEHYIWIEGSIKNLLNDASVGSLVINYRDITTRKNQEQELLIAKLKAEQSAKKLALAALIIDSSEDAIISKNLDGFITSWNPSATRIFGYHSDEILGKHEAIIIGQDYIQDEGSFMLKLLNNEQIKPYETSRITKEGKVIHVSISISAIFSNEGKIIGLSKVIKDITEKKLLEKEKLRVLEDLIQRNRDLEQFSFIVSHNLRAPVANILGTSDMLISEDLEQEIKDTLVLGLNKSANALDTVIRDLNYILQKKREINEPHVSVSFSDTIHEITQSISHIISEQNVVIESDFKEINQLSTVKTYLYSVFYNLISNSIKYKKSDVAPIIKIKSWMAEDGIKISFEDNGLGIDLDKKGDQLFMLYKRFHYHTEGRGMGLYMVKSQVESLGGKVAVESKVNLGTKFILHFPVSNL